MGGSAKWQIASDHLVLAAILPLSPDEAYYWVWSRDMQPGYLDHPPMVAIFIWLGTAMAGESALGVRLLGPVSLFIGSLMLARTAEDLFPGRGAGPCRLCQPWRACRLLRRGGG